MSFPHVSLSLELKLSLRHRSALRLHLHLPLLPGGACCMCSSKPWNQFAAAHYVSGLNNDRSILVSIEKVKPSFVVSCLKLWNMERNWVWDTCYDTNTTHEWAAIKRRGWAARLEMTFIENWCINKKGFLLLLKIKQGGNPVSWWVTDFWNVKMKRKNNLFLIHTLHQNEQCRNNIS